MALSKRLSVIASFVSGSTVADIGTDHGMLALCLAERSEITKVVATELNINPLERAKSNISHTKVELRFGFGLQPISAGEVDTVIIAGMGGHTIADILNASPDVVKGTLRLILQPQHDIAFLRRFIHNKGINIINEQMVFERGKYYTVIVCENGEPTEYDDVEYEYGKILIDRKCPILRQNLVSKSHEISRHILINEAIRRIDAEEIG
jgi:tRNA (adenine22-N1)-methyltransferase